MKSFNWKGYNWYTGEVWGETHPDFDLNWFDDSCVTLTSMDHIILNIKKSLRHYWCGYRTWGVGRINCCTEFKYGKFEWKVFLPKGTKLLPALWLKSSYSWPPEIDCMEGLSGDCIPTFNKRLFWYNIHPTCHWKTDSSNHESRSILGKTTLKMIKPNDINKFTIEWRPDKISIWYNDYLVGEYKDEELLDNLNKEEIYMSPCMSIDQCKDFKDKDFKKYSRPFEIIDFKYEPLKDIEKQIKIVDIE